MRALLDVNVLIAGLLSRTGAPARLLGKWLEGEFELVISDRLLDELEKTLARPKLRRLIDDNEASAFIELLVADSPNGSRIRTRPRASDLATRRTYLIAAASSARATLVTRDADLLQLAGSIPVISSRALSWELSRSSGRSLYGLHFVPYEALRFAPAARAMLG